MNGRSVYPRRLRLAVAGACIVAALVYILLAVFHGRHP